MRSDQSCYAGSTFSHSYHRLVGTKYVTQWRLDRKFARPTDNFREVRTRIAFRRACLPCVRWGEGEGEREEGEGAQGKGKGRGRRRGGVEGMEGKGKGRGEGGEWEGAVGRGRESGKVKRKGKERGGGMGIGSGKGREGKWKGEGYEPSGSALSTAGTLGWAQSGADGRARLDGDGWNK